MCRILPAAHILIGDDTNCAYGHGKRSVFNIVQTNQPKFSSLDKLVRDNLKEGIDVSRKLVDKMYDPKEVEMKVHSYFNKPKVVELNSYFPV